MSNICRKLLREAVPHLRWLITAPKQPQAGTAFRTIRCDRDEMSLVAETNALFHVTTGQEDGYFCPCRPHTPLPEYVREFIDDYFSFLTDAPAFAEHDRSMVLASLEEPDCFERFTSMSSPVDPDSPCSRFLCGGDPGLIGLKFDGNDVALRGRMSRFIRKFAFCQLNAWSTHRFLGTGKLQTGSCCRSLAAQSFAGLLGLEAMFPHCEYVRLQLPGQRPIFGLYTAAASGIGIVDISRNRRMAMLTPGFQRELSCLNVIDAITHEMDHSPNNYNVVTDIAGNAVGLSVFDNNGVGTFSLQRSPAFRTYKNCSPFLRPDGTVNRPHLDAALCRRLQGITLPQVIRALRAYLRFPQILCLWLRLRKVTAAIRKTASADPGLLLEETEWSADSIQQELSGIYGKTYMTSYLQDCCVSPD